MTFLGGRCFPILLRLSNDEWCRVKALKVQGHAMGKKYPTLVSACEGTNAAD